MFNNNLAEDLNSRIDYNNNNHQSYSSTPVNYGEIGDELLASLFVNNHDDNAFSEIVDRYGDKIFRLALRITRSEESAEEILQNVFIKLIEKLETFREESKLSTWIYSVSSNESFLYLRNRYKNRSRQVSIEELSNNEQNDNNRSYEISDQYYSPDENLISSQHRNILDKAINELPEEYRVVFQLRDIEGLSNNEVADILGLSLPAVKSRILRARNQLRKKLLGFFPQYQN